MALTLHNLRVLIGADTSGLVTSMDAATGKVTGFTRKVEGSTGGVKKLQTGMLALARQATGLNPAVANLTNTIASFGIRTPQMIGILAGIAAVSFAYRKLTRDTREAREEQQRLIDKLKEAGRQRVATSVPGMTATRDDLRSQLDRALTARSDAQTREITLGREWAGRARAAEQRVEDLTRALYEQNKELREGERAFNDWLTEQQALPEILVEITRKSRELKDQTKEVADAIREETAAVQEQAKAWMVLRAEKELAIADAAKMHMGAKLDKQRAVDAAMKAKGGGGGIGAAGGGTNWGQVAALGGGVLVGSGLLGSGAGGSGASGAFGGAMTGAALGSVIPGIGTAIGAVVGGVAGLVGGLIGHSKKAREEAEQLKKAQKVFDMSLAARKAMLEGDAQLAARLQLQAQQEKDLADAIASKMSKASVAELRRQQAIERTQLAAEQAAEAERKLAEMREQALRSAEDLLGRAYSASGQDYLSAQVGMMSGQRRYRADAVSRGAGSSELAVIDFVAAMERQAMEIERARAEQIAAIEAAARAQLDAIDAQTRVAEEAFRVAQDQLRAQERTVESLRAVVDNLKSFRDSMKLGPLSPLSPKDQLAEAQRQVEMLRKLAMGGDASAAASLPDAIRTLLDLSKQFNASGPGFVEEFERSQKIIDEVTKKFGRQLTIEEQMLAELEAQTGALADQIELLKAQAAAVQAEAQKQIDAINAAAQAQYDALRDQFEELKKSNDWLRQQLEELKDLNENITVTPYTPPYGPPHEPFPLAGQATAVLAAGLEGAIAATEQNTDEIAALRAEMRLGLETIAAATR